MRHLVVALGLWGCGGATGATPESARAQPIATPIAPASVAPAPTNLVIGKSIGPVSLGMARADVTTALVSTPDVDPAFADYDQFPDRGFEVEYDGEGRATSIHAYSGEQGGYETRTRTGFALRGPAGITWSSTYDDVVTAMGRTGDTGELPDAPIPTHWLSYGNVMFDFITSNGHLFHVVVFAKE